MNETGGQDPDKRRAGGHGPTLRDQAEHSTNWGEYGPAIQRWEAVLGRPCPDPTMPGRNGPRLSPRFVEWVMGLPDAHVTGVPNLSTSRQLQMLGNGVVPQQIAAAADLWLTDLGAA
jgi:DNA (cytosine-5)-methyltransferase 1